eukprot:CAMPEP_0202000348 /NCGR_PEP_ID=MMETSP0905-20130828/6706_1 /ASSEMBLY_ACC=CAM_ASM_000554 /TAXON_ID=420261 /ORGANISM="Thalassiosira antarctica, Strain CCMP982" /LENGTH=374 /DNA_ID=CAMNT_0048556787 /DNA_START=87 /DNA_END=1208 /DNA_ORIENTATION=+
MKVFNAAADTLASGAVPLILLLLLLFEPLPADAHKIRPKNARRLRSLNNDSRARAGNVIQRDDKRSLRPKSKTTEEVQTVDLPSNEEEEPSLLVLDLPLTLPLTTALPPTDQSLVLKPVIVPMIECCMEKPLPECCHVERAHIQDMEDVVLRFPKDVVPRYPEKVVLVYPEPEDVILFPLDQNVLQPCCQKLEPPTIPTFECCSGLKSPKCCGASATITSPDDLMDYLQENEPCCPVPQGLQCCLPAYDTIDIEVRQSRIGGRLMEHMDPCCDSYFFGDSTDRCCPPPPTFECCLDDNSPKCCTAIDDITNSSDLIDYLEENEPCCTPPPTFECCAEAEAEADSPKCCGALGTITNPGDLMAYLQKNDPCCPVP